MNFKINLSKTASTSAEFAIEFLKNDCMLYFDKIILNSNSIEQTFDYDLDLSTPYTLRISRHEYDLYKTNNLTHTSHIIVNHITLDNFWILGDKNHWSKTVYDSKYLEHLRDRAATWELTKDLYNNVLYFNGYLEYTITTPIRDMYFK